MAKGVDGSMKVILMSADGVAYAETAPSSRRQIQLRDGYHFVSPVAVHRDIEHQRPSILVCWQGRPIPEGGPGEGGPAHDAAENFFLEQSIIKDHKGRISVSKVWVRSLTLALTVFGKTAVMVIGGVSAIMVAYIFSVIL